MERSRRDELMDGLAATLREVPLDDAGNPMWELPDYVDDDPSGETDNNPLGSLVRNLAKEMTHRAA